jgi:GAF domain-containing protein
MSETGTGREELVSRAFVALADTLVDDYDIIDLLHRLVRFTVELLAADAAGIVLADARGELRAVAASNEAAELMELLQLQSSEGPCLDCYHQAARVSVTDLHEATARWPAFTAALAEHGAFRSVHALPLRLRKQAIGALNLFHGSPGVLPGADLALGQALADVATIGILQERTIRRGEVLNEQLHTALNSRVVIEQAKGGAGPTRRVGHGRCIRPPARLRQSEQRAARRRRPKGRHRRPRPGGGHRAQDPRHDLRHTEPQLPTETLSWQAEARRLARPWPPNGCGAMRRAESA